jgi:hypothetical protein
MSTIVTYNRTVAPNVDGLGGPVKMFNDFAGEGDAAFFTAADFAIAAGENGVFVNADGSDVSSAIGVLNTPNLSKEGDYIAFAIRAKMSAQTSGDDAYFGLGDVVGVSSSLSHALAFGLTQSTAASGDTIIGAFDDGTASSLDTPVTVISDLIEDWDSTEYHVYAAEVKVAGGALSAQWYIDGKPLASKRVFGAAVGTHEFDAARLGLFFYQAATTSLLTVDWVSYEATRK